MKDGHLDTYVFPDAAAAERFADATRRAKRALEEREASRGEAGELATAGEAAGARIDEVRRKGREVTVELTTNPDTDLFAREAGQPEPTAAFLSALSALVSRHGGELLGTGAVTLGPNRARLDALRAEGKQAFGVLVAPLEDPMLYGSAAPWMARVDAPADLVLRGSARLDGDGEPRTFQADLARSILRLRLASPDGPPPAWRPGDVVVLESSPAAARSPLGRLLQALGL